MVLCRLPDDPFVSTIGGAPEGADAGNLPLDRAGVGSSAADFSILSTLCSDFILH